MRLSQIQGCGAVCSALSGMALSGKVPHAIMFHEDDGGGGVALSCAFLQLLMCRKPSDGDSCGECPSCAKISKMIHPDVHFVYPVTSGSAPGAFAAQWRELVVGNPSFTRARFEDALSMEGKSPVIGVPQVKALIEDLSLSALEGGYRCVVMYLPEMMNQDAANRLLKLIEEPPSKTQFLLVTHSPESVLQTISSRCQRIRLMPLTFPSAGPSEEPESVSENRELFASLCDALLSRNLSSALEVGESLAALPSRERMKGFCTFASQCLRNIFLIQQGMPSMASCGENEDRYRAWAAGMKKTFPRKALEAMSRSRRLLERNVAQKIVFTDLVDRLFLSV